MGLGLLEVTRDPGIQKFKLCCKEVTDKQTGHRATVLACAFNDYYEKLLKRKYI